MSDRSQGRGRGRGGRGRGGPSDVSSQSGRGDGSSSGRSSPPPRGAFRGRGGGGGGQPAFRGGRGGRGGPPVLFAPHLPVALEPRLAPNEQDALIARFKSLAVTEVPVRPGFGTAGVSIKVRANFFPVKYPKNATYYEYKVNITPKTDIGRLKKRIFQLLEETRDVAPYLHEIAHDRTQRLISRKLLPQPFIINVPYYEDGEGGPRQGAKVYALEICNPRELRTQDLDKYLAGELRDYDPQPILSAFNLITSQHPYKTGINFGKNRYFFPGETFPLGIGIEAWKGYYSSVRPAYKQLMVNVNVCMSAFYSPATRMSDALLYFQAQSRGAIPSFFGGSKIRVTTTHLGYRARKPVKAIANKPATKIFFECEELGGTVSVAQYFQRKYQIQLRHGDDLPCVNIGGKTKDNWVPAELCEIEPGQPFGGVLDDRATAEMIKYACNPPSVNATSITEQGLQLLGLPQRATPIAGFGVTISTEMAVVPARQLPPPTVSYSAGNARVADGSWNILGVKFHKPAELKNYAILVIADGGREDFSGPQDPALHGVVSGFLAKCRSSGMRVAEGLPPLRFTKPLPGGSAQDPFRHKALEEIESTVRTLPAPPQLLLVFMSAVDKHVYPGLKRMFDVKLGIHTVCMLTPKIRKQNGQDQYFSNNALKVNVKLGGVNHRLDAGSMRWIAKTMLVGMDVTHPGYGTIKGTPSIVAVVASCDDNFTQYPASMRLQKGREEMIQQTKEMMIERLNEYKKCMGRLPERIMVYRDGVSEGEFDLVRIHELPQMHEAFRSFAQYKPKLTIIICGKRHHARAYPTDANAMDRTGNNRAGTVIDRGITAVYDFDFYLQAHAGLQGTTRATHYTVVYDENKLGADEIQVGTNAISYLWARATKAVSLAPPAYWADQACERGRCYLHEILPPTPGSRELKMSELQIQRRAEELWGEGINQKLRGSMFYL